MQIQPSEENFAALNDVLSHPPEGKTGEFIKRVFHGVSEPVTDQNAIDSTALHLRPQRLEAVERLQALAIIAFLYQPPEEGLKSSAEYFDIIDALSREKSPAPRAPGLNRRQLLRAGGAALTTTSIERMFSNLGESAPDFVGKVREVLDDSSLSTEGRVERIHALCTEYMGREAGRHVNEAAIAALGATIYALNSPDKATRFVHDLARQLDAPLKTLMHNAQTGTWQRSSSPTNTQDGLVIENEPTRPPNGLIELPQELMRPRRVSRAVPKVKANCVWQPEDDLKYDTMLNPDEYAGAGYRDMQALRDDEVEVLALHTPWKMSVTQDVSADHAYKQDELAKAVLYRDASRVHALLAEGANPNLDSDKHPGVPIFILAAGISEFGGFKFKNEPDFSITELEIFKALVTEAHMPVDINRNIQEGRYQGMTALHFLCTGNDPGHSIAKEKPHYTVNAIYQPQRTEAVMGLLDLDANPNMTNVYKLTPLHFACGANGHAKAGAIRALLCYGDADTTMEDDRHWSAEKYARNYYEWERNTDLPGSPRIMHYYQDAAARQEAAREKAYQAGAMRA